MSDHDRPMLDEPARLRQCPALDRTAVVVATGVGYVAVGALTLSPPVLDLGFELRTVDKGDAGC